MRALAFAAFVALASLITLSARAQTGQGGYGPGTGTGASSSGPVGAPQIAAAGGAFGTQQNTIVVNGGAGGLSGTSGFGTTANTRYFVSANDTETAALTITAANVTVECNPGVTIQQTTASTALFTKGAGAANFTVRNCGLGQPTSGTCAPVVNDTPTSPTNNLVLDNVELNFNSSTCTDSAAGWVNISGGSGHRLNVWDPFSDEHVIVIDNQTPTTHNNISDVRIRNDFGPLIANADGKAIVATPANTTGSISYVDIDINFQTAAYGIYSNGNGEIDHSRVVGRGKLTANTSASGMFKLQVTQSTVGPCVLDDGGKTGANYSLLYVSDGYDVDVGDCHLHATGATQNPINVADMHGARFHDIVVGGDSTDRTGQLPTNGWSTSKPCASFNVDGSSDTNAYNVIDGLTCFMPPSSTANGIDVTCPNSSSVCDGNVIGSKNQIIGNSTSGSCINITNSSGTSAANDLIVNPFCKGFTTGITIGSGVSGTQVNGAQIVGATTPVSDSGTNSRIVTHEVLATGTLSSGTLAVTFSGNDPFTSGTVYNCEGSDQTTVTNAVNFTYTSGTAMTITGTGTDVIRYRCRGY